MSVSGEGNSQDDDDGGGVLPRWGRKGQAQTELSRIKTTSWQKNQEQNSFTLNVNILQEITFFQIYKAQELDAKSKVSKCYRTLKLFVLRDGNPVFPQKMNPW